MEKENLDQPEKKKLRLSLKKKDRFPLVPAEQIEGSKKEVVPANTEKATQWALR